MKKHLTYTTPASASECRYLPTWSPNVLQLDPWAVGCHNQVQWRMRDVGLTSLGQVIDGEGEIIPWENQFFLHHIPRAKQLMRD